MAIDISFYATLSSEAQMLRGSVRLLYFCFVVLTALLTGLPGWQSCLISWKSPMEVIFSLNEDYLGKVYRQFWPAMKQRDSSRVNLLLDKLCSDLMERQFLPIR